MRRRYQISVGFSTLMGSSLRLFEHVTAKKAKKILRDLKEIDSSDVTMWAVYKEKKPGKYVLTAIANRTEGYARIWGTLYDRYDD